MQNFLAGSGSALRVNSYPAINGSVDGADRLNIIHRKSFFRKRPMSLRETIKIVGEASENLLIDSLMRVIQTFDCRKSPIGFQTLISLMESLPLSTAEFGLARNRLDNARRYADSDEPGAAIYELRLLLNRLRKQK
jgi:hypothetical protein